MDQQPKISTSLSCTEYMRLKAQARRRRLGIKPKNKISPEQEAEIIRLRRTGVSYSAIMKQYPIGYARLKRLCECVTKEAEIEIVDRCNDDKVGDEGVVDEKVDTPCDQMKIELSI